MTQEKPTKSSSASLWSLITWPWRLFCRSVDWTAKRCRGFTDIFTGGPMPDDRPEPKKTDAKRNTAWGLATVAGVLALLLMLAWQIHGLLTDEETDTPSDLRLADNSLAGDYKSVSPNPDGEKHPDDNTFRGPTIAPPENDPNFNSGEPPVIVENNPKEKPKDVFGFSADPPKKTDDPPANNTEPPAFNLTEKTDDDPPKKSPFDTGNEPVKNDSGNPVVEKKKENPTFPSFGPPEKKEEKREPPVIVIGNEKKQPTFPGFAPAKEEPKTTAPPNVATKKEDGFPSFGPEKKDDNTVTPPPNVAKKKEDGFPSFGPEKKTDDPPAKVADTKKDAFPSFAPTRKQPAETTEPPKAVAVGEPPLSLEVIRNDGLAKDDTSSFLVTSLLSTDEPIAKAGGDAPEESFGWKAVRWAGETGAILPVRYNAASTQDAGAAAQSITIGSTATSTWTVGTPKLSYQIVVVHSGGVGDKVALRLLVTNSGSTTLTNVAVHLDLPPELKYKVGRKLEHRIDRLEPGKTHVARLTPVAVKAGRVRIRGKVIAGGQTTTAERTVTIGTRTASRTRFRTSTSRSPGCCGTVLR